MDDYHDPENPFPEPVIMEITDILDLHHFSPKEVPDLLDSWFEECLAEGFREVRVIHGRGRGVLRNRVHSLLKKHPSVTGFALDKRNPGVTLVILKEPA